MSSTAPRLNPIKDVTISGAITKFITTAKTLVDRLVIIGLSCSAKSEAVRLRLGRER